MTDATTTKTAWRSTYCDSETVLIECGGKRSDDPGWGPKVRHQIGWAVCWVDECGREYLAPMRFGRKKDADRAAETVNKICDWGSTFPEIAAQINEYGRRSFREALVSELAW